MYTHAQVSQLPANIPFKAWTGGNRPNKWQALHARERNMVRASFREQMMTVKNYWSDYHGCASSALDQARIQWRSARYNAYETILTAVEGMKK